jgi:hypothetical protein
MRGEQHVGRAAERDHEHAGDADRLAVQAALEADDGAEQPGGEQPHHRLDDARLDDPRFSLPSSRGGSTVGSRVPFRPCVEAGPRGACAQLSSVASRLISALSSLETGQPALALAASVWKVAGSAPGTLAFSVRCDAVMA